MLQLLGMGWDGRCLDGTAGMGWVGAKGDMIFCIVWVGGGGFWGGKACMLILDYEFCASRLLVVVVECCGLNLRPCFRHCTLDTGR